jgi:hypothetical protein
MAQLTVPSKPDENLVGELRQLILDARRHAAATVNVALTLLYWRVGNRIHRSVLGSERAGYGERILATLSHELSVEFGRGFEVSNLARMVKFAEAFPDENIVGDTVATIELVAFPGALAARQTASA